MISEQDYNKIANDVYKVDSGKVSTPRRAGDTVADGKYQVLKVEDNRANGMQAMAVAPVDKSGKVDYSQVVIAYAGTNFGDGLDLLTDAQQLGLGRDTLYIPTPGGVTKELNTQFETAQAFAKEVEKEVRKKNPKAVITTAGHSLGESIALYVALKQGYANLGFNGPDIHNLISDEEIKYMQEHPEQFVNYRHKYDNIGSVTGNKTGVARYPKVYQGHDEIVETLDYHRLAAWKFTEDGQLIDLDGRIVSEGERLVQIKGQASAAMSRLKKIKGKLSKGGYSSAEKIFLDSQQVLVVVKAMADAARAGSDTMKGTRDVALEKSLAILGSREFDSFQWLSYDEVEAIYAEHGVDEVKITALVSSNFDSSISQVETLAAEFETLLGEVQTGIQAMLEADAGLASDFDSWLDLAD